MIIKTTQRGEAAWLSAHLTRTDANEAVTIIDGRGVVALDVHVALRQFEAQWRIANSRARDFLVHASISPAQPLSNDQWTDAWGLYEEQHGLFGQPYIEVEHAKPGDSGRPSHRHRAYLRIRPDGRAVHLGHSFQANEVVARLCELRFGHPLTKGAHNRAVVAYLEQHGYSDEAGQLRGMTERRRPRAGRSEAESQQESRSGSRKATAAECAAAAWRLADSPLARRAALAEAGFILARGDRRNAVLAVDAAGEAWALHRLLAAGERGAWTAARVRKDLEGVVDALPTVEELRGRLREGVGPEKVRSTSEETGGLTAHLLTSPAERMESIAPAPMDDADSYWPTEADDVAPTRPSPAPIVCRLGAGATIMAPDAADDVAALEMRDMEGHASPPAPPWSTAPSSPTTATVPMKPPSDGRRVPEPSASPPPTSVRAVTPAPRRTRQTADTGELRSGALASRRATSKTEAGEGAWTSVSPPHPTQQQSMVEVGRSAAASGRSDPGSAAWAHPHDGIGPVTPSSTLAADRHMNAPRPLDKRRHDPIPPHEPALRGSVRADDRGRRFQEPNSNPLSSEETRRRDAHSLKLATRRIRDLAATAPRRTASTPVQAPAGMPPLPSDEPIMRLLASYVGALMDWWAARQRHGGDAADAPPRRRLDEAWRALLVAARAWLSGKGAGEGADQVQTLLTREIARNHQHACDAHERWLDRMYPPSAAGVDLVDRTSNGTAPAGHRAASRRQAGPEQEITGA
ncbi:hypothetical protein FBZ82_11522 [Azospirillum brasilense]|uniref:Relaxase/mobilization nuclease-like protein n=1 Tax=Azospirillum brasilense TaxID=192 RepID=A0A560AP39_AZOBR|nr:hypothetical protein [Azospirillum brasilense]TWA62131.1 hypothetical protein FBZ82_11522 [Azospirillum brasilense]